jgi:hypothetical protein
MRRPPPVPSASGRGVVPLSIEDVELGVDREASVNGRVTCPWRGGRGRRAERQSGSDARACGGNIQSGQLPLEPDHRACVLLVYVLLRGTDGQGSESTCVRGLASGKKRGRGR